MSAFAQASAALFAATSKANGGTVTYTRPGIGSVDVTATFGRSVLVVDDRAGARIEVESDDFIVLVSSLVIDGDTIIPQEGDRVVRVIGALTYTYELMEPPYKPSDTANVLYRLHSKVVSTA